MPVTAVDKDADNATMTMTADFDSSVDHVWQLWSNPRLLERWWGPPTWPATFDDNALEVGNRRSYYMTGPDGEKAGGYWEIVAVDPPKGFELLDGFADESGTPNPEMPVTRMTVTISATANGARMLITSKYASVEAMQQLVEMGMEEGMKEAMSQIDGILAELKAA